MVSGNSNMALVMIRSLHPGTCTQTSERLGLFNMPVRYIKPYGVTRLEGD
jgi:hypothetical protein